MDKTREKPIKLLLKWAGSDKWYLFASVLCAFLSGLFVIGPYVGIYRLMDAVLLGTLTRQILADCIVLVTVTTILRTVLLGLSGVLSHKGAYNALFKVRCMITEHLAKVPLGYVNERSTGEIKTVLNESIEKLELCLAHNIPELVSYLTGPIVIFVYLMTVNVPLALISLIPLLLDIPVMMAVFKKMSDMLPEANASLAGFNSVMVEYVRGMRLIKAYRMGSQSFKKFREAVLDENRAWNKISKKTAPLYAVFILLLESGLLMIVPLGGRLFLRGAVTASVFLLFAYIGSLYLTELLPLQQLSGNFAQAFSGITKAKEILELPIFEGGDAFPENHDIALKGVRFSYDGKTSVLENCSLCIQDGEKIAVVGASGAGKSTVAALIARFYDADDGEVLIGGKNVKSIRYEALLEQISLVFQKTFLTQDSVLDNIRMGMNASLEQVREAAKGAQIDDFIMSLPDGYDTKVGSYGSRFSGGEKQRIAIARAILKNAPILILDEATSAADPENQLEIDKAIRNLCKGKTVVIIAHRLSVVGMCDKVAVVENRTISDIGTHDELLSRNRYYQRSWESYESARNITYGKGGSGR
ncbi:ABC transporter ATP-binding protein [Pseudoramibacter faecis]|uniref:ABC transporter ATP-binding protein n=1 Tax=Pseudoramibacter faecis TaxID=3108534 RepID=UPI002E75C54D|nr:ABC transporter ATP-binding protein [Pseudoramibacter sp. HA2172]